MTTPNLCPDCGRKLTFAPNGRSRLCEICGYQESLPEKPLPQPAELVRALNFAAQLGAGETAVFFRANARLLLAQGIGAAKEGSRHEAYSALEKTLRTDADDTEKAEAWFWLAELYDDPADKRLCLEQALVHQPTHPLARRGMALLDGRLRPGDIINPDQLAAPDADADPQAIRPQHFQCPRCASRMNYTADRQALVCEFCEYRQELGEATPAEAINDFGSGGAEQDFVAALHTARGHLRPVAMRAFNCQGCGVEFVLGPETLSLTCPYCDSVYVTEAAETRQIQPPQALIPFSVSEDGVRAALRNWFKERRVERPRLKPFVGLYAPVWTFDLVGDIAWNGQIRQRNNQWLPVSGNHQLLIDDLLIPATPRLPDLLPDLLPTYDTSGLQPYDPRYLADWPAERYQLALADASLQARRQVVEGLRKRPFVLTNGRSVSNLVFSSSGLTIESFKLILLPLWLIHYRVEQTVYDLLLNGQTAAIVGQSPQTTLGSLFSWLKK